MASIVILTTGQLPTRSSLYVASAHGENQGTVTGIHGSRADAKLPLRFNPPGGDGDRENKIITWPLTQLVTGPPADAESQIICSNRNRNCRKSLALMIPLSLKVVLGCRNASRNARKSAASTMPLPSASP